MANGFAPGTHLDLTGKVALVTGASAGLGRHFALTLARAGAKVGVGARRVEKLEELVKEIDGEGGQAHAVAMNVDDPASIATGLDSIIETLGPVTTLVNNAGITIPKTALDLTREDWDSVIQTNLNGAFYCAQATAKRMIEAKVQGSIINISSITAFRVGGLLTPYMAAKAGLSHLTSALAFEWARHDIRVNAMAPGYILTDLNREFFDTPPGEAMIKRIPMRRLGNEQELEGVLLLLASDAASYMTGITIPIDGGHLCSTL